MENTCLKKLKDDTENQIKELKEKIIFNEKSQSEYESIIFNLEENKKQFEIKKEENDRNKSLKENITVKLSALKEKLENVKSQKIKLHNDYLDNLKFEEKSYNDKISSCDAIFNEKKTNATIIIENAQKLYDNVKNELLSIESPIDDLEDCRPFIDNFKKIKTRYLEDVSYNNAIKENNDKLLKEQKEDKNKLNDLKLKLNELKSSLTNHNLAKELMGKTFPNYALDKISDSLVQEINDFIESIYYKELNIKFEPNKNSLKMTYSLNNGRDLPIIKLSGAETNIVDLSVISVFNNRQKLNCLVMDEVDNYCSDEVATNFLDVLMQLTERYEQTIIITHKKELQNRLIQNGANVIRL